MFLIRRTTMEDVATLLKLAKMVHFINLPADNDIIAGKVQHSRKSFMKAASGDAAADQIDEIIPTPRRPDGSSLEGFSSAITQADLFMFTLEDTETGAVLGSSQVVSSMSGPGRPSVSFKLSRKEFFSESLQTGTSHTVAKLYLDESGPSEIGGLILQPSYRSNKAKLGKLLSLIRFHFMALNRPLFADKVLAEMMAPISPDGTNLLWDYLGRRFISLSYTEADRFCRARRSTCRCCRRKRGPWWRRSARRRCRPGRCSRSSALSSTTSSIRLTAGRICTRTRTRSAS
jgi:arginine N-succinyltransferase